MYMVTDGRFKDLSFGLTEYLYKCIYVWIFIYIFLFYHFVYLVALEAINKMLSFWKVCCRCNSRSWDKVCTASLSLYGAHASV